MYPCLTALHETQHVAYYLHVLAGLHSIRIYCAHAMSFAQYSDRSKSVSAIKHELAVRAEHQNLFIAARNVLLSNFNGASSTESFHVKKSNRCFSIGNHPSPPGHFVIFPAQLRDVINVRAIFSNLKTPSPLLPKRMSGGH